MLLKQAKKTQKRINTFESVVFPSMELDQLPLPFYENKTEEISLDLVEFSEVSDSFSKEFESIIEEVFSDKYEQYTYDQTSSIYEQAALEEKESCGIEDQEMEQNEAKVNSAESPQFDSHIEENLFLADFYEQNDFPVDQTEIEPFSKECTTNGYEKIVSPEVITKRVLKGDLTKEPVLEIAKDNIGVIENEEKNERTPTKVSKSLKSFMKLLEKYPIYTQEDILKQELAFEKFKERIHNERISNGTRGVRNSFITLVVGPYYLGKFGYKLCLRNMAKFSIAHLEEFKDINYQELLKYAKLQSLNLKEENLSLHDKHYKKWLETDGSVTQIPSICYRNLGNDTGSLFPDPFHYGKTYSTNSRKTY